MGRIVVLNHVSLDGVMQAPGRPDEDTRGGFSYGGWAAERTDEVMARALGERRGREGGGLLLGGKTYEDLLSHWNQVPNSPYTDALNNAKKYVVSSTLKAPLPWPNSTLLQGELGEAVTAIKGQRDGDLVIMGSGVLIQSLLPLNVIDEFLLMIHPVVLGSGRRLFPDSGALCPLQLVSSLTTTTGVIIATYQRPA